MNLIFDWSGTLADDERLTFELTRDCVAHFGGGDLDWEAYRSEFTIPVDRFYGSRCPGTDIAEIDRWFFESYGERLGEVALFDGVAQLLGEAVREHRLFILSTLKTDLIAGALSRLGLADLFEEVVGDAFDKRDHLPSLIRRHGLEPMETLFFGDTTHDVEAGRASGLQTAAVTWGYTESSVLEGSRPYHLFRRVPGVARHLRDVATLEAAYRGGLPGAVASLSASTALGAATLLVGAELGSLVLEPGRLRAVLEAADRPHPGAQQAYAFFPDAVVVSPHGLAGSALRAARTSALEAVQRHFPTRTWALDLARAVDLDVEPVGEVVQCEPSS